MVRIQTDAAKAPKAVQHATVDERVARGREARKRVPRKSHAEYAPRSDRPDPVTLLEEQAASRVPELVPIRYGRMLASPFAFFRGGARLMASDLAGTPVSGFHVQICGDAHLSNFGMFASPERRLVFDINDFDETLPGPWEWDVKRLAASIAVAGRENGFAPRDRQAAVLAMLQGYRETMAQLAAERNLNVWYASLDVDVLVNTLRGQVDKKRLKLLDKGLAKARTRDSMQAMTKFTELVDGEPRIVSSPPLIETIRDLAPNGTTADQITELFHVLMRRYRETLQADRRVLLESFRFVDIARKVVGVGSVGTRAWILLMLGKDNQDPLFLQFKEAQASVLEEYLAPSVYRSHAHRVVIGQHLMQASSDIFLGWLDSQSGIDGESRDFYGRQFRDWKGSIEVDALLPDGLALYSRACGWTLARAHARSGDRIGIAAYLGSSDAFDRAITVWAEAYADQNEADYQRLAEAADAGRIEVISGI
jgi:uncharacterized protein (DUF2252 family)